MAADIYGFLANFGGGGARPNRYEVILTFPKSIGSVKVAEKISFTCKSSAIPSSNLGVAIANYKGREIKLPGDKTWDDWNITLLLDTDFVGRATFEEWHESILGFESNLATTGWQNATRVFATAQVNQLDREDKVVRSYTVQGIFPTSVGEISLDYSTNDTLMEQPVTFAVNGWKVNK